MSRWLRLTFLLLGALILAVFLRTLDLSQVRASAAGADRFRLALAVALIAVNLLVKGVRWRMMVGQIGAQSLGLPAAAAAVLAGVAAGSLTPARGLELAKPLMLRASHGVPVASSVAAVLVERILDGAALVMLFGLSLVLVPAARGSRLSPALIGAGMLILAAGLVLFVPQTLAALTRRLTPRLPIPARFRERLAGTAERFSEGLLLWRQGRRLAVLLGLSIGAATLEVTRFAAVLAAIGAPQAFFEAALAFSAANLLGAIMFIPGGLGITEVSMVEIIRRIGGAGTPHAAAAAAVLLDRVISYYLLVAGGGLILMLAARTGNGRPRGR